MSIIIDHAKVTKVILLAHVAEESSEVSRLRFAFRVFFDYFTFSRATMPYRSVSQTFFKKLSLRNRQCQLERPSRSADNSAKRSSRRLLIGENSQNVNFRASFLSELSNNS